MNINLIKLPPVELIVERLPIIFPEGLDNRNYCIRDISARTIFVMMYIGAIEGNNIWIRPDQVTKMSDMQASKQINSQRLEWCKKSISPGKMKDIPNRWYSVNTRESIRDETIRELINKGAIVERQGLPTTSSKPRYSLKKDFVNLFLKDNTKNKLEKRIKKWQKDNLTTEALARIQLVKRGSLAALKTSHVLVQLPNGETRRMSPGPSSILSKDVLEVFAKKFLIEPALIFLSESSNKVVAQDNQLAALIGLSIKSDKNLPDIILADLRSRHEPLILFIEVVSTDGPINKARKNALLKMATEGGFKEKNIVFLTAFKDRGSQTYRRLSSSLAWGSFAWFSSEPESIINLIDKRQIKNKTISDLL